jgi:hypothetical protein
MIPRIEGSEVPFTDMTGNISRLRKKLRQGPFAQRKAFEAAPFESVDAAGAMWITPGKKSRAARIADRAPGIMLCKTDPLIHESVEGRGLGKTVIETGKIPVSHIIDKYKYNIRIVSRAYRHILSFSA